MVAVAFPVAFSVAFRGRERHLPHKTRSQAHSQRSKVQSLQCTYSSIHGTLNSYYCSERVLMTIHSLAQLASGSCTTQVTDRTGVPVSLTRALFPFGTSLSAHDPMFRERENCLPSSYRLSPASLVSHNADWCAAAFQITESAVSQWLVGKCNTSVKNLSFVQQVADHTLVLLVVRCSNIKDSL